jgi:hypothetical protein
MIELDEGLSTTHVGCLVFRYGGYRIENCRRYSRTRRPDMINFLHAIMLGFRGTVSRNIVACGTQHANRGEKE